MSGVRGQKRRTELEGDGDDASATKIVCVEQAARFAAETPAPRVVDVETVPAAGVNGAGDTLRSEIPLRGTKGSSVGVDANEIIGVGGVADVEKKRDGGWPPTAPPPPASPRSRSEQRSSEEEDVDVMGGSSPVPGAVTISWTESPEHEEGDEDIDVV